MCLLIDIVGLELGIYARLLQCSFHIGVQFVAAYAHSGQNRAPRIRHKAELFQSAHTFFVQLCPRTVFLSGDKALHPHTVYQFMIAVNPAETKCLFLSVNIPEFCFICGLAALYSDPTLACNLRISRKPAAKFTPIFCRKYILRIHPAKPPQIPIGGSYYITHPVHFPVCRKGRTQYLLRL